jgi:dTDP-glucose 4,6-dehydratase
MGGVVVAGGAGFIGSHVCAGLVAAGRRVICVDNFLTGCAANVAHLQDHPLFRLVEADVSDEPFRHGIGEPLDAVLNLASPASPEDYLRYPLETLEAGALGTLHTLELAREHGARYLLASTSEVYGDPQVHPQPERYWGHVNPVGPRSVYDEAKRYAEALTTAYRDRHGLRTGIARFFNTYGPGMRRDDGRAIPTFIRQALGNEPLTVAGDGSQTRSVCFVDDLVAGIRLLLDSGHAGPVNLGNPEELPVLRIAQMVREQTRSDSPITFIPRPQDDPSRRCPDITLARELLGWTPTVPAVEGIRRTVDWFRDNQAKERVCESV